jgi:hypothetical protein
MEYAVLGVVPVVLTVNNTLAVPPANSVTLVGFKVSVGLEAPPGEIEPVMFTIPENPPILVSVIEVLPEDPRVILIADCWACSWKSGERGGFTWRMSVTV